MAEPRGCPTPGACSALHLCAEVERLQARVDQAYLEGAQWGWDGAAKVWGTEAERLRAALREARDDLDPVLRPTRLSTWERIARIDAALAPPVGGGR